MEEYLKAAYRLYTDLIKLHKKYALSEAPEGNIIEDINAINDKYQADYCNAMTDSLRRWHKEQWYGAQTAEDIKQFYTEIWKMHKKYAGKFETAAGEFVKEQIALSATYSGNALHRNRPVETIMMALADEIEKPTLRG